MNVPFDVTSLYFFAHFIQRPRDGQDIQHGVHVLSDVDKDIKQEHEHVLVVALAQAHVLVHLLREGLVEGLEVSRDTEIYGNNYEYYIYRILYFRHTISGVC